MRSKSRALTIDEVRARFEEWRQNRQGKSPIPDELWSAAAELARKDGINQPPSPGPPRRPAERAR